MKKRIFAFLLVLLLGICLFPESAFAERTVYIGGVPMGIELNPVGVIIVSKSGVPTADGVVYPLSDADVVAGDIILEVDGKAVSTAKELASSLSGEGSVTLTVLRGGKKKKVSVTPVIDSRDNMRKLGLAVKEKVQGIGTLTFCDEKGFFASLGHPVSLSDDRKPLQITGGKTDNCYIMGTKRGENNKAGELKGVIVCDGKLRGDVLLNSEMGLYGKFDKAIINKDYPDPFPVAKVSEVKTGKAKIITCISGNDSKEYEIEIIKKENQLHAAIKGMVIKITDQALLEEAGGILQGMSGSPIVQNGKLVGAVTHVMLQDATKGYAIYAEFMLQQLSSF